MHVASSWQSRTKKSSRGWKASLAILAVTVVALRMGALKLVAQQGAPPSAPASTAPEANSVQSPQSEPLPKAPTIHATVQLVNIPLTATNKRGQRVIDLGMDDLKVSEDGVEQKITHFERETRTPLRIGLILDTSNSARSRLSYEKDAAQQFVDGITSGGGAKVQIFLETFDASSSIVQDFTSDPDLLSEKIQNLSSGGGKALYDAIYFACREKMLKTGPAEEMRRILVVVSDGLDVQSQHTVDQAVSMARMAETMIYTVGTAAYGFANPGDKFLADMATETGGFPYFPLRDASGTDMESGYLAHNQIGDTSQNKGEGAETGAFSSERLANLVNALQAIDRGLSEQYTIGYKPLRDALDGTYRTVKVETTRRGVNLRWKPGYFATAE
jgi:Ca-activated chloride channel homolog